MLCSKIFPAFLLISAPMWGQIPGWRASFEAGKQAYAKRQYAEAAAGLNAAAEAVMQSADTDAPVMEILRYLSAVHREKGDLAQAEQVLQNAAEWFEAGDPEDLRLAATLEEISVVQRAQGRSEDALATIGNAIAIRGSHPEAPRIDMARDLTAAAMLRSKGGDPEKAIEGLARAVREWDLASPGDPQSLPAIEALASAHRDRAEYEEAEPLLLRALRLREASNGPEAAEAISAVDSLAYVEFGLKKFAEAEVLYKRLAALWEKNAGADHPMLALTFDKMAEFYAFQQRYEEAEKFARDALALRTKMHVGSLNQTGRVLLMEAKLEEAEKLYHTALEIGDLASAPDDVMDPLLRTYATILKTLKRDDEAAAVDARVKDALLRKADREGRRPSPVTLQKK
ncbi:putative Tetratricopeptide domain protein [Candidatus Sulfopaludibacter sp. SbA4]|nr:putative Tetratricopeptide domain protein [Candidatus Sulfopaludibacter sp. SbA4]